MKIRKAIKTTPQQIVDYGVQFSVLIDELE